MVSMDWMEQELSAARRELAEAEGCLSDNTNAARTRYARALHEADLAEQRAARLAQKARRPDDTWQLAAQ